MTKEELIGLGLIAVPFMVVGASIGGFVMDKINNKYAKEATNTWKDATIFLKEKLAESYDKNAELSKQYWEEISRKEQEAK
jgi:hypothetical protein